MNKYSFSLIVFICLLGAVLALAWQQAAQTAAALLSVTRWVAIVLLTLLPLGALAFGASIILYAIRKHRLTLRQKTAEVRLLNAQAAQAEQQARTLIVTASPGEQVFLVADADNIIGRSVSALHLQRSYRANGIGDQPSLHESAAWALRQHLHSTLTAPRNTTARQLPASKLAQDDALLPQQISLLPLLDPQPGIERIIIGQTLANGRLTTLTFPLLQMVHVGIVGSSGWGKSAGVQSLALQLALAKERPQMAFIDLEGVTSAPFQRLTSLRYPVADTEQDAIAILQDLKEEMRRRLARFGPHRVQKLPDYNALPGVDPLPFIAVFIDEVTALLEDNPAIHNLLARIILQLRKTGIFLFLAGQEMNKDAMRPKIRRQLGSRIAFHVADHWQSQGLGFGSETKALNIIGRAWTILPGQQKMLVQAPFIEPTAIEPALQRAGRLSNEAAAEMPPPAAPTPRQKIILQLYHNGASLNQISKTINNGRTGGTYNIEIKAAIQKFATDAISAV
jgi:hypothetical protein